MHLDGVRQASLYRVAGSPGAGGVATDYSHPLNDNKTSLFIEHSKLIHCAIAVGW